MLNINSHYLLIILFIVLLLTLRSSIIFLDLTLKKILFPIILITLTFSILFILVFINKIDLVILIIFLILISIFTHIFSSEFFLKLLVISLKSYYIFLLSFTTCFCFYETISRENIYVLSKSNYGFLVLFLLAVLTYIVYELWFSSSLTIDKFDFAFTTVNHSIIIFIFIMLIVKNYSFFYILNFSRHSYLVSILFLTSSLVEIFFSLFIVTGISKAYDLSLYKYKNQILTMQYKLQVNNLKQLEIYESKIKTFKHDLNNHKIVLHNLITNKDYHQALQYIEYLSDFLDTKTLEIYTNHKILNALFLNKKESCLNNNIKLELDIQIPKEITITDFDICIIVGNLIDNAIEACLKLDKNNLKYIKIKSRIINSNFVFEIINSYNGVIKTANKTIFTTKKDTINHGLGLSIVQSTINKYNGTFLSSVNLNEFTSLVIIPLS